MAGLSALCLACVACAPTRFAASPGDAGIVPTSVAVDAATAKDGATDGAKTDADAGDGGGAKTTAASSAPASAPSTAVF